MHVDIVVVSYNTRDLLRQCLASISSTVHDPEVHTFVVDNQSADGAPEMVREEFPNVHMDALDRNPGFGAANNIGMAHCDAPYILFLNPDAQLVGDALAKLVDCLERWPKCVAVGPRLEYPDGTFQRSCRYFPNPARNAWSLSGMEGRIGRITQLKNWLPEEEHVDGAVVDMVSGACFLARRSYMDRINGFDENLFMYEEEADVFLPARRRKWEVRYCADATVIHACGGTVENNAELREFSEYHRFHSKYYCFRKHYGDVAAWGTLASDVAVLGASAALNALRRKESPARKRLGIALRAWRDA